MNRLDVPVLIVGGGGAGLTSSMLLSQLGVETLLVSALPTTSVLPKAVRHVSHCSRTGNVRNRSTSPAAHASARSRIFTRSWSMRSSVSSRQRASSSCEALNCLSAFRGASISTFRRTSTIGTPYRFAASSTIDLRRGGSSPARAMAALSSSKAA